MDAKPILTRAEAHIVECIADECLSAKETAESLHVIYQCVKGHLQNIYDKLGTRRNLQALTKWYYAEGGKDEVLRRIGAMILLLIFSVEVLNSNPEGRVLRVPRRGRREKTEYVTNI